MSPISNVEYSLLDFDRHVNKVIIIIIIIIVITYKDNKNSCIAFVYRVIDVLQMLEEQI